MNEACLNFAPIRDNIGSAKGRKFAIKLLKFMRERISSYQEETGQIFNLEATPGEGTSYRFAKHDRKRYPDIIAQGGEVPYYTNSTQLPVNFTTDMFEALDHQDEIQCLYTGGTVIHLFLGEKLPSNESVKNLVRKVTSKYSLPYFSITPTFSICPIHGYIPGEHEYCPKCDAENGICSK
jgi:ribonucleoside-triphosphate reductase